MAAPPRVDLSVIEPQPVFSWLQQQAGLEEAEMLRTFNCGIGMICIVSAREADRVMLHLAECGETAVRLGEITATDGEPAVTYRHQLAL